MINYSYIEISVFFTKLFLLGGLYYIKTKHYNLFWVKIIIIIIIIIIITK